MPCRRFVLAVGAVLLAFTSTGWAVSTPTPEGKFVQDLADKVLTIFNDPQLSYVDKERRLYPIAVAAFDVPRIARFVLGRYWSSATEEQQDAFTKTFEKYMVHVYAGQFNLYHNVAFDIVYTRPEATRTLVRSRILERDKPPLTTDWWVIKSGNTYKIIDVNLEGVSQLISLREQFVSVISQHQGNVAALTEQLREKMAE